MNCKFRAIAGALALCALVLGASGCKKTQTPQGTQSPLPTLNEPHSHPDKPADSVPPQGVKVPHQHCGLKISLPEDATAAPSAEDKNLFNFQVKSISGTVRFGSLSELGKGTTSSLEYAKLMVDTYGAETTKEGTSTNVAFYALRVDGDDRYMYSLYTYKSPDADTTVCWLVEAKCHADDLQLMREIVGCCGWDAQQIPEL
jgi:hypothetical protein